MLDARTKKSILRKILNSDVFSHSQGYQNLLTYLVEASIQDQTPKEYSIATDVLHKDPDFDPSQDTIVRVTMYNLRKKLNQYYAEEGTEDPYRIDIPKGHYEITFRCNPRSRPGKKQTRLILYGVTGILLCGNLILGFFLIRRESTIYASSFYTSSPIWRSLLSSGKECQIVLGDHFFYIQDSNLRDKRTIMRRDDINTERDFLEYQRDDPSRRSLKKLTYPMFPRNSVWPFADLLRVFIVSGKSARLNYASNLAADEFRRYNLVFVGSFHTLFGFQQTFHASAFSYRVYPNVLSYYDAEKDSLIHYPEEGDPLEFHTDYGLARKIPGPDGNTLLIITGFHETGTEGIVKYFTQPEKLSELENEIRDRLGTVPEYFEILFRSTGYDRTDYKTTLLQVHEISKDTPLW